MSLSSPCDRQTLWFARPDGIAEPCQKEDLQALNLWNSAHSLGFEVASQLKSLSRTKQFPQPLFDLTRVRIDIDVRDESFSLIARLPGEPEALLLRDLPLELLSQARSIQRRSVACERVGQKIDPSAVALEAYNTHLVTDSATAPRLYHTVSKSSSDASFAQSTSPGTSLYVECLPNELGVPGESAIRRCPRSAPDFVGGECRPHIDCNRLPDGTTWRTPSMLPNEFWRCQSKHNTRAKCAAGLVFDGVRCVNAHFDACAGKPDGTMVACPSDRYSYRVCNSGSSSRESVRCPPHKPLFYHTACASELCREKSSGNLMSSSRNISSSLDSVVMYECKEGEAVVRRHPARAPAHEVFRLYLSWAASKSAGKALRDGLEPLFWFPMWPPWLPVDGSLAFEDAARRNSNQITLWRVGCIHKATPFSHALLVQDKQGTLRFVQTSTTALVCVAYALRDAIPFAAAVSVPIISKEKSINTTGVRGKRTSQATPPFPDRFESPLKENIRTARRTQIDSFSSESRELRDSSEKQTLDKLTKRLDALEPCCLHFVTNGDRLNFGDERVSAVVRRKYDGELSGNISQRVVEILVDSTCEEGELLKPAEDGTLQAVSLGVPMPAIPLLIACQKRPWTCYFPTQDTNFTKYINTSLDKPRGKKTKPSLDSEYVQNREETESSSEQKQESGANSILIAGAGGALSFNLLSNGIAFRTVTRQSHGFRTYAYAQQQTFRVSLDTLSSEEIEVADVVTIARNPKSGLLTRTVSRTMHSFLDARVFDTRSRNGFTFAGKRFASFHSVREAFLTDSHGKVKDTILCTNTGRVTEYPFMSQLLRAKEQTIAESLDSSKAVSSDRPMSTADLGVMLHSASGCIVRTNKVQRAAVFGVGVFFDEASFVDNEVFLPLGFAELSVLPRNIWHSLPHLPLNLHVSSNGLVTVALRDDLSSDAPAEERARCITGGSFWDYEADRCMGSTDGAITEEAIKLLFLP